MKIKIRPYENWNTHSIMDELHKISSTSIGYFWLVSGMALILSLFWNYLKLGFWITIGLIVFVFIIEAFDYKLLYEKKHHLRRELKLRNLAHQKGGD